MSFLPRLCLVIMLFPCALAAQEAPGIPQAWRSEAFSEVALTQLKALGKALHERKAPASGVLSRTPSLPNLRPEREVVVDDARVRVAFGKPAARPAPNSSPWAALLEPFSETLSRTKFKLVSVDLSGSAPVTDALVTLAGKTAEGLLEINMRWQVTWETPATDADVPRIRGLELAHYEEILVKTEGNQPSFVDATAAVLGGTEAYQKHLRHGNTYWRQRIELFNRFFKFGHQGVAVGDVNGDGRDDVYVCQNGGLPNRLFVQQPDGTAIDVAAEMGVDLLDLTRSALLVDLDNDGDQDLVLAADTGLLAFRNNGSGRFEAKLRYRPVRNAFSVSAADYDNDGDLDLYVCRYFANKDEGADLAVPVPYFDANNGGGNFLIRNDGAATTADRWLNFTDATAESGLAEANNTRFSFAATWEDVDLDGDQDLFVANDFGLKNLYLNESGHFRDHAKAAGIDDGSFGMSAASADYDGDGRPDLYAGNMFSAAGSRVTTQPNFLPGTSKDLLERSQRMARGNSLFRNTGRLGVFEDVSMATGATMGRWSWGSIFADVNNDGWEDLLVANGFVTGKVPDDL